MRNQGLEATIRGTILDKPDFRWDATLMGSFNRNKVLGLTGGQDVITSGIRVIEVGRPIYTFYLPKTAGVDPRHGQAALLRLLDPDGRRRRGADELRCDEYITDNVAMATLSKYYHESREPKLFGSIGSTFTILKNIDVFVPDDLFDRRVCIRRALQRDDERAVRRVTTGIKRQTPLAETWRQDRRADARGRRLLRHGQTTRSSTPRTSPLRTSPSATRFPSAGSRRLDIESLRIYATLDNIAMFNHMDGMDPQYNFTGTVAYSYTPSRVIAFGIDLNFLTTGENNYEKK